MGVDPISEKYAYVTTFNYAENEPVANIDLWGLQAITLDPEYWIYEGSRQMLKAVTGVIDAVKMAFGKKDKIESKQVSSKNLSGEISVGIKNTTTVSSNLSEIFDQGNYTVGDNKYDGPPLLEVKNETKEFTEGAIKGSKGLYQASLSQTKNSDGSSSTTAQVGVGTEAINTGFFMSTSNDSHSKNSQKVGIQASTSMPNKDKNVKKSTFFFKVFVESK